MSARGTKLLAAIILVAVVISAASLVYVRSLSAELRGVKASLNEVLDRVGSLARLLSGQQQALSEMRTAVEAELEKLGSHLRELEERLSLATGYPMIVTDALNRSVVILSEPRRVVSIAPSITEIVFAIGAGSKIVGVDDYSNYPPELLRLIDEGRVKRVGGFANPSIEAIVALSPDLVLATTGVQARVVLKLEKLGVTTVALPAEELQDVYYSILMVGRLLNSYEGAARLVREISANITAVAQKVSGAVHKPRVLFIVWPEPLFVVGGASWINDLIELAGGVNVFADVDQPYPMASPEQVVASDPEVIIVAHYEGFGTLDDFVAWASEKPGWANITAIAEGRVYLLRGAYNDVLVRPGPRVALALELLAVLIHPELFGVETLPNVVSPETLELPPVAHAVTATVSTS